MLLLLLSKLLLLLLRLLRLSTFLLLLRLLDKYWLTLLELYLPSCLDWCCRWRKGSCLNGSSLDHQGLLLQTRIWGIKKELNLPVICSYRHLMAHSSSVF